jgi:hypothetical protein
VLGLGTYTFTYARGWAYLTDDAGACANCHVMHEQYDGWIKKQPSLVGGVQRLFMSRTIHDGHASGDTQLRLRSVSRRILLKGPKKRLTYPWAKQDPPAGLIINEA